LELRRKEIRNLKTAGPVLILTNRWGEHNRCSICDREIWPEARNLDLRELIPLILTVLSG
jgi:hypothetical protein